MIPHTTKKTINSDYSSMLTIAGWHRRGTAFN
jgi:hypothetical protein